MSEGSLKAELNHSAAGIIGDNAKVYGGDP